MGSINIVGRGDGKHLYSLSLAELRVQLVYRVCQILPYPHVSFYSCFVQVIVMSVACLFFFFI